MENVAQVWIAGHYNVDHGIMQVLKEVSRQLVAKEQDDDPAEMVLSRPTCKEEQVQHTYGEQQAIGLSGGPRVATASCHLSVSQYFGGKPL